MGKEKDPAFLWYPGDYIAGTTEFTFEEKGAYVEILMKQFEYGGPLPEEKIKRILRDKWDTIWPAICEKFKRDEHGNFFNDRLEKEREKRKTFTESRRRNLKGKNKDHMEPHMGSHTDDRMENENGNEIVNEIKDAIKKRESEGKTNASRETDLPDLTDYNDWTEQMIDGNDMYFQTMLRNDSIPMSENLLYWIHDHRDLLNRYPKMRPPNQQAFRQSCLKHVRENYKKTFNGTAAGTNKKQQHTANAAQYVADHYAAKLNGGRGKPHG